MCYTTSYIIDHFFLLLEPVRSLIFIFLIIGTCGSSRVLQGFIRLWKVFFFFQLWLENSYFLFWTFHLLFYSEPSKFLQNRNDTFPFSYCDISLLPPERLNDVIVLSNTPWMSLLERIVEKKTWHNQGQAVLTVILPRWEKWEKNESEERSMDTLLD